MCELRGPGISLQRFGTFCKARVHAYQNKILKTDFSFTESTLLPIVFSAGGLQPQDQRTLGEEAFREGRG